MPTLQNYASCCPSGRDAADQETSQSGRTGKEASIDLSARRIVVEPSPRKTSLSGRQEAIVTFAQPACRLLKPGIMKSEDVPIPEGKESSDRE